MRVGCFLLTELVTGRTIQLEEIGADLNYFHRW